MYGTQTTKLSAFQGLSFENDVKMYGTQTRINLRRLNNMFENDVKMYGTQTIYVCHNVEVGLRMM